MRRALLWEEEASWLASLVEGLRSLLFSVQAEVAVENRHSPSRPSKSVSCERNIGKEGGEKEKKMVIGERGK